MTSTRGRRGLTISAAVVAAAVAVGTSATGVASAAPDAPRKWDEPTPAMAAGLADLPWSIGELLQFQIPLPRWLPQKRRGRPPKHPPLKAAA